MAKQIEVLVEARQLKKHYRVGRGLNLKAVDGIDLTIGKGETLGLVGESGCGKSTTGKLLIHLIKPTSGSIYFDNRIIKGSSTGELEDFRRQTQIVFQDPYSSLNPRMKVMDIIAEGYDVFKVYGKAEREEKVLELLEKVGLKKEHANRYPHEFSGGQRQRIGIARAISMNPRFVVCDEPISALDVSIQAQIVNLLNKLQRDMELTYLFISHDIKMVKLVSDNIAVMYLGKIVEKGKSEAVFKTPVHPYSKVLLSAIPIPNPRIERTRVRISMEGELPNPINRPEGCVFAGRCPYKKAICTETEPELKELENGRSVACHFAGELI